MGNITTTTYLFISMAMLFFSHGFSQESLSKLLKKYNSGNIPYYSVEELAMPKTKALILDAREVEEFNTSHIKNAIHVGFENFNLDCIHKKALDKNKTIIVYCSLGIRSEKIAIQLRNAGYKAVYNLYGGIFEWRNKGFKIYDINNEETNNIHVFSKTWSVWINKGNKIYK